MRFPVFARRADPRLDAPILHKKLKYVTEEVKSGRADWVDPSEPRKGIVCREMLYFGPRQVQVETVEVACLSDKAMGLKVIPAKMEKNPTLPRVQFEPLLNAAQNWDWSEVSV